jgi:hypothetical protein
MLGKDTSFGWNRHFHKNNSTWSIGGRPWHFWWSESTFLKILCALSLLVEEAVPYNPNPSWTPNGYSLPSQSRQSDLKEAQSDWRATVTLECPICPNLKNHWFCQSWRYDLAQNNWSVGTTLNHSIVECKKQHKCHVSAISFHPENQNSVLIPQPQNRRTNSNVKDTAPSPS